MLDITDSAIEVVEAVREQQGVPDHFGLRVFPEPAPEGIKVQIAFAEEPVEGDQVAKEEGTRLFVAPELVDPLSEVVIDAEESPEGRGLVFREQGTPQPS